MIIKIFKLIFIIVCLPFIYNIVIESYNYFDKYISNETYLNSYYTYGFIGYIILYIIILRKKIKFLETFEHELAHLLTSILFFKKIYSFNATDKSGGYIENSSDNFIIILAPYFIPVFTIPFLILKPFIISEIQYIINVLIGITLSFHFTGLIREFSFKQSDIKKCGYIFSVFFVITLNIIIFTAITQFSENNTKSIKKFWNNVYKNSVSVYNQMIYSFDRKFLK
jgi:hypothetical protein